MDENKNPDVDLEVPTGPGREEVKPVGKPMPEVPPTEEVPAA